MYRIRKHFNFDAAHKLPNHPGKCANLHGHTWKGYIEVCSYSLAHTGMVIDFKDLSTILEKVLLLFDHSYLNNRIENPTAEILAEEIFFKVKEELKNNSKIPSAVCLSRVMLAESDGSEAVFEESELIPETRNL